MMFYRDLLGEFQVCTTFHDSFAVHMDVAGKGLFRQHTLQHFCLFVWGRYQTSANLLLAPEQLYIRLLSTAFQLHQVHHAYVAKVSDSCDSHAVHCTVRSSSITNSGPHPSRLVQQCPQFTPSPTSRLKSSGVLLPRSTPCQSLPPISIKRAGFMGLMHNF